MAGQWYRHGQEAWGHRTMTWHDMTWQDQETWGHRTRIGEEATLDWRLLRAVGRYTWQVCTWHLLTRVHVTSVHVTNVHVFFMWGCKCVLQEEACLEYGNLQSRKRSLSNRCSQADAIVCLSSLTPNHLDYIFGYDGYQRFWGTDAGRRSKHTTHNRYFMI